MRITLALIVVAISLSSCGKMVMTYYGIHNPAIEDSLSIAKYCKKKNIPVNNIYTVDFSDHDTIMKSVISYYPDIRVYNKDGYLIPYANSETCNAGGFTLLQNLDPSKSYDLDSSSTFKSIASRMKSMKGNEKISVMRTDADFYVVIFWTKWTGRLNKTHVIPWETKALENTKANVMVYKLNLDIQEYWNFPNQDAKMNFEKDFKVKFEVK